GRAEGRAQEEGLRYRLTEADRGARKRKRAGFCLRRRTRRRSRPCGKRRRQPGDRENERDGWRACHLQTEHCLANSCTIARATCRRGFSARDSFRNEQLVAAALTGCQTLQLS